MSNWMKLVTTVTSIYVVLLPARHFVRQVRCTISFIPQGNSWVLYSTDEEIEAQINYLLKVTQLDRKVEADFEPQTGSFQFVALTTPPWLTSLPLRVTTKDRFWAQSSSTLSGKGQLNPELTALYSIKLCGHTHPFSKFMFSTYTKYISSNLRV